MYEDLITIVGELFSKHPDFKRIKYRRIPPPRAAREDLKRTSAYQILRPVEALVNLTGNRNVYAYRMERIIFRIQRTIREIV